MSVQIGSDSVVSDLEQQGASFVTKVDLSAWAPLCKVREMTQIGCVHV